MSLVEEMHAAHKARLARLSPPPVRPAPVCTPIQPMAHDAGWENMWFFDLTIPRAVSDDAQPKIDHIQRVVSEHFGISKIDLLSQRRTQDVVRPRQIAMYLCRTLTHRSLPEIGRRFGGRDHTTVLHAVQKIKLHLAVDDGTRREVAQIRASLR